jgi:hypothetical protein
MGQSMSDEPLRSAITIYSEFGRQVAAEATTDGALQAVTTVTARSVPGADAVSITREHCGKFQTAASSSDAARQADLLQYDIGAGPCVDAVTTKNVFRSDDLAVDARWPEFGPAAVENTGLRSVLSIRLSLDEGVPPG